MSLDPVSIELQDRAAFDAAEAIIASGLQTYLDVGRALASIRDGRGYRHAGYATWETYVEQRWHIGRAYSYRLMRAAEILDAAAQMSPIGDKPLPAEGRVREIASLPTAEAAAIVARPDFATMATPDLRALKRSVDATLKTRQAPAARRYTPPPIVVVPADPDEVLRADAAGLPRSWTGIADVVMTSPPYGLEVAYANGVRDPSDYAEYSAQRRAWCAELYRIANPEHGRVCVNVPIDTTGRAPGRDPRSHHHEITPRPIAADWTRDLLEAGFQYRATLVWWDNEGGAGTGRGTPDPSAVHAYAPAETVIVVYRGASWKRLDVDPRDHDLGHDDWLELAGPRACFTFPGASDPRHPAVYPERLVENCLRLYSYRGDMVVDPFCGRGTTGRVAVRLGRRIRLSDLAADYVELTRAELALERAADCSRSTR